MKIIRCTTTMLKALNPFVQALGGKKKKNQNKTKTYVYQKTQRFSVYRVICITREKNTQYLLSQSTSIFSDRDLRTIKGTYHVSSGFGSGLVLFCNT